MGLFSRNNSPKGHDSRHASPPMNKGPGLEPLQSQPRTDGRGETLESSSFFFDIGMASDCNSRYRKTMEDASVVILDYMGISGCAYFAIYDGHAGAQCATMVAQHLHSIVADIIQSQPSVKDIPLALSEAFQSMDEQLKTMDIKHSGSTAVVAITCYMSSAGEIKPFHKSHGSVKDLYRKLFVANVGDSRAVLGTSLAIPTSPSLENGKNEETKQTHRGVNSVDSTNEETSSLRTVADSDQIKAIEAKRLSYDHRCGDVFEQRRVSNAGGIMINNRVNGMLAVTRSLGDLFMKDYVIGAPYTTESDLKADADDILVMACDGLWDVSSDDKSMQLVSSVVKDGNTALAASRDLLDHALSEFSVDNLTILVIRFRK